MKHSTIKRTIEWNYCHRIANHLGVIYSAQELAKRDPKNRKNMVERVYETAQVLEMDLMALTRAPKSLLPEAITKEGLIWALEIFNDINFSDYDQVLKWGNILIGDRNDGKK
ncbi:hypothetical protein K9L16_01990 [Candidatus Pacearchaeota archaeon]|nr:hypothetical protein [Candidatus Pacearchaeota archaeon]